MKPILAFDGLSIERDGRWLIQDLSETLLPGDIVHLAGGNGSGKTTMLRALAGLSSQHQGEISRPDTLVYIGHGDGFKAVLSPLENLRFAAALGEHSLKDQQLLAVLEKVGLRGYEETPCQQLSAGQKRRVNLARLFITSPLQTPLWLLDEPFVALDIPAVAALSAWISEHCEAGGAVMFSSHQPVDFNRPCKTLALSQ